MGNTWSRALWTFSIIAPTSLIKIFSILFEGERELPRCGRKRISSHLSETPRNNPSVMTRILGSRKYAEINDVRGSEC